MVDYPSFSLICSLFFFKDLVSLHFCHVLLHDLVVLLVDLPLDIIGFWISRSRPAHA